MKSWIATVFRHLLSGKDNRTPDIARVIWFLMSVEFMVLAAVAVATNKQDISFNDFGVGAAALLAAGGIAVGMKTKAEPE